MFYENSLALENLGAAVSNVLHNRFRGTLTGGRNELSFTSAADHSDGESTVSDGSDDSELSESEITAQTQRNATLLRQYMEESYLPESEIRFSDGPLDGEAITLVGPPFGALLHMPEEGDVDGPENLQFQPCLARDVGLFVDIWTIISGRGSELGQSKFNPGDLIEATCCRHATLLFSETCISLLFIAAIESERSGRGQFLNDVKYLSILTWQEHVRRLFQSKGATATQESNRRRSGGTDAEGNSAIEELCAQIATRDFHLIDIDCKITMLRCLLLACTQPGASLQKVELKSICADPRPKRQAAKSCLAGLDAMTLPDKDVKRRKIGNDISEALDSSCLSTAHVLGRGCPLGIDRHGNRYYHISSDPGRIFCESSNKMWWMVYETSAHITSLLQYLHPSGREEHSLIRAIVDLTRVISKGIAARSPEELDVPAAGKKVHGNTKNKALAAKCSGLVVPDWLADAEGYFVARQLMCLSVFDCSASSVSSCVAPGVGYSNLTSKRNSDQNGLGAVSLFGVHDAHAEGESLCDSDEQLVSRNWLPVFLRRRRFSNQVRLYENSLHFSGFRSLCSQAHLVNRALCPLTSSAPTKSCFDEVFGSSSACEPKDLKVCTEVDAGHDASTASPADLIGPRANQHHNAFTNTPGVYDPFLFLKAHALRLSETILSVVKPSYQSEYYLRVFRKSSCYSYSQVIHCVESEFSSSWRAKISQSDSLEGAKSLIFELEEACFPPRVHFRN